MAFQRRKVAVGVACALGITGGLAVAPATAQDIRVEVTGSNIKRVDTEGPAPVTVLTREDIEQRGQTTVAEVLRSLPQAGGFTFDDQFTNSFAPGTAGIGLRNLGQNATLVLVNGRRVANYGFAQNVDLAFVDLNSIPLGAIERIEVLTDGASAIYGSDAIAGVVNIILRRDFKGTEVSAGYGVTDKGDGNEIRANVIAGWGDLAKDRFNAMLVADYFHRDPINLGDRTYSRNANMESRGGFDFRSPSGSPGTWVQRAGTTPGLQPVAAVPRLPGGKCLGRPVGRTRLRIQLQPVHRHGAGDRALGGVRPGHLGHHQGLPVLRRGELQQHGHQYHRRTDARIVPASRRAQQQPVVGAGHDPLSLSRRRCAP